MSKDEMLTALDAYLTYQEARLTSIEQMLADIETFFRELRRLAIEFEAETPAKSDEPPPRSN